MHLRLNKRFALVLFGSLTVLGTGTHYLHGYQVRRTSGAMLDRARQLETEGQLNLAADYLGRYLSLKPDDTDALASYGTLLADKRLATSQKAKNRAWLVLNKVLYRTPDRLDVRRQVVRLAMDLGRYGDARDDIEHYLRPAFPNDGELSKWMGSCYQAAGKYREARHAYEDAVRESPHDLDAYSLLVQLLRTHAGMYCDRKRNRARAATSRSRYERPGWIQPEGISGVFDSSQLSSGAQRCRRDRACPHGSGTGRGPRPGIGPR